MARRNGGQKSKRPTPEVGNVPSILDKINLDYIDVKIERLVEKLRGPNGSIISSTVTNRALELLARNPKMVRFAGSHRYTFEEALWACRTEVEAEFLGSFLQGVMQVYDGYFKRLEIRLRSGELKEVWDNGIKLWWDVMLQCLEGYLNRDYAGGEPSLLQGRMSEFEKTTGDTFKMAANEWREKVEEAVSDETFGQVNAGVSHPIRLNRTESARAKIPRRKPISKNGKKRRILPAEKRARTVAKIIEELNVLKPSMRYDSDYEELKGKYPNFVTFKIAAKQGELREKVVNLQDQRRHYRLAQELAAAYHGRELSTLQTDWKKYKPKKFRRTSS
jgi:hypothetical protein